MAASRGSLPVSPPLSRCCSSPSLSSRRIASSPVRIRRRVLTRRSSVEGIRAVEAARPLEPVEVVGIGSRKDAVIDFCLGSRTLSSIPIRFWTIHMRDTSKVQLTQRIHGADVIVWNLELPLSLRPCPPAVILIASAGHGVDHITAMELLNAVKSAGRLATSIFLKPFSFEGQRRQEEAADLIGKLKVCSNFYVVIEADSLLEAGVETLAEALESANNAVLSTVSMISIMMSGFHQLFRSSLGGQIKEINHDEVGKLLESYGEARLGFGAGYNVQSAIKQAVFHCPFLRGGIKDLDSTVFVSLMSARILDESDMISTVNIFRRVSGFARDIIFCRNSEPYLEPKLIVITLLTVGCKENADSGKEAFLSSLAFRFPFISSLIGRGLPEQKDGLLKHSFGQPTDSGLSSVDIGASSFLDAFTGARASNLFSAEKENARSNKESNNGNGRTQFESVEADFVSDWEIGEHDDTGAHQEHSLWNSSPGFGIAQLWAKERAEIKGSYKIDEIDIFTLPVGVKSSELQYDHSLTARSETSKASGNTSITTEKTAFGVPFTDLSFDKVMDICNSAMAFLKGKNLDESRKHRRLASRAASMLDAERELEKTWSPIVEMQYRGGTYRGRCQEGVPEGKGRLIFAEGSFYYGIWRYGKRYGLGTFCYSNGDVFHGTWRDDLMHGKDIELCSQQPNDCLFVITMSELFKAVDSQYGQGLVVSAGTCMGITRGWFFFHGGDRWFANFWKGKAEGEGRFYSKDGSIFFGHFQNGWRHGEGLWIDANGSRWLEVWNEGVLVSRTKLEKDGSI